MRGQFRNSGLSLVLVSLFVRFWEGQAVSGWNVQIEDAQRRDRHPPTFLVYLGTGHFWQATAENWFQSFQNWESEVLAAPVTSICLRQDGSQENKEITASNARADT